MLPLMNALEFDAMTMHGEFAYGPAQACKLTAGLMYLALAINSYDRVSDQLVFDPSCVIKRGGLRIGIIGIASNIIDKSMPPRCRTSKASPGSSAASGRISSLYGTLDPQQELAMNRPVRSIAGAGSPRA